MLEQYGLYALITCATLVAIGWIWLVVAAFHVSRGWGWSVLLFPPAGVVFVITHVRACRVPLILWLLAGALIGGLYGASYYQNTHRNLGERAVDQDGELRLNLTGWDRDDYGVLKEYPEAVIVEMANSDVTDETLRYLVEMKRLRSLDLRGSAITDKGLETLAGLPKLEDLKIGRTKITEDGFRKYLAAKESLKRLEVTGLNFKGKTKRAWKKAVKDRKVAE